MIEWDWAPCFKGDGLAGEWIRLAVPSEHLMGREIIGKCIQRSVGTLCAKTFAEDAVFVSPKFLNKAY